MKNFKYNGTFHTEYCKLKKPPGRAAFSQPFSMAKFFLFDL